NVAVDRLDRADELAKPFGADALSVCVEIEGDPDVAQAEADERAALLADLGVHESVLPRVARGAYHLLGRRTFLTTGEDETRAWSFRAGAKAPECAGVIHSDLQRGFIRAEVIDWRELLDIGSWDKAKELGKIRVEGKEYEVRDGGVPRTAEVAETSRARRRGLLGRRDFEGALVLRPCRHVHTLFMRLQIDVALCDGGGRV